jgi:hypothetical protein
VINALEGEMAKNKGQMAVDDTTRLADVDVLTGRKKVIIFGILT